MKFNKRKFNVILTFMIIVISLVIVVPTLLVSSVIGDNESQDPSSPLETVVVPEEKSPDAEIYKFKTAYSALKQGLANMDAQGGYTSKITGLGSFSTLGVVNVSLDINANKYENVKDGTQYMNMTLTSHGIDFLRMKSENTMINIGPNEYLSYDSGTMNEQDQTRALYQTRSDYIGKYGKIHTEKFMDFPSSSILSYRIENYNKYQKVIMKVKQSEMESIVGCLTDSVRVDLKYKCLAAADIVFYISQYGDLLSVHCSVPTELKIGYGPFSVTLMGTFDMKEEYFAVDNEVGISGYNAKLEQYPILTLDKNGKKIR